MQIAQRYTRAEFDALISRETERVEFKRGLSSEKVQDAIVAFSNTHGGAVFIGVADDGTIVGKKLDKGTEERLHEVAASANDIGRYLLRQVSIAQKPVVAVVVDKREEGFAQTSQGRVLVRKGPRNVALMGAELATFVSSRALRRFETSDSGLGLLAVDQALVEELSDAFGWDPSAPDLGQRLSERGLLRRNGKLTIAGALLLTDPGVTLRQRKLLVDIRRYRSDGVDYDRRVEIGGPLHHQVRGATEFVMDEVGQDVVVTGMFRHELPRLPPVVVREVIANAVAHRSYEEQGSSIVIEIRPDRVSVRSPGGLPPGVTVENLRRAQSARNQYVIDALRRFHLAEDAGRGIDVIEDTMLSQMLDPPRFSDDGTAVEVQLPMHGPVTPQERVWIADLENAGDLEPIDRVVLVLAARGDSLTNAVVRENLGVDRAEARIALQRLRDRGFLVQHGERGGTSYSLQREIVPPAMYRLTASELEDLVVEAARRGPIANRDVRALTGMDYRPALALLRRLVAGGRLVRTGSKRGTRYIAGRVS